MSANLISVPLMVAVPAATWLITGDMRTTILYGLGTALGIIIANVLPLLRR